LPERCAACKHNLLAGIITVGPLFVTYLIFSFLLGALAKAGLPVVQLFAAIFPEKLAQPALAAVDLGDSADPGGALRGGPCDSLVIGRQAFDLFEAVLERLPFVAKIYTSVRQLLDTMMPRRKPASAWCCGLSHSWAEIHWVLDAHADRLDYRRSSGRSTGTLRHQPDFGLFADFAHRQGYGYRHEHGAGDEYVDDGRRGWPESIRFSRPAFETAKDATPPAPSA